MFVHSAKLSALFLLSSVAFGQADGLKPVEAQRIAFPGLTGTAYYTNAPDGLHVVATLVDGGGILPFRIETVLGDGQRISLSVAGEVEATADTIDLVNQGGEVRVIHATGGRRG